MKKSIQQVKLGDYSTKELSQEEKEIAAYHIVGHEVMKLCYGDKVNQISIKPRNNMKEYHIVVAHGTHEHIKTKADFEKELLINLAGRAAEEIFSQTETNLCEGDWKKTNKVFLKNIVDELLKSKTQTLNKEDIKRIIITSPQIKTIVNNNKITPQVSSIF